MRKPPVQTVATIMTREPLSVDPDAPIAGAIALMAERRISCIVACRGGRPAGVVSERDLVRLLATGTDVAACRVADLMATPVVSVPPEMTTVDALSVLRGRGFRRLPVVDGEGALLGIVTQSDLLRALLADLEEANRLKLEFLATIAHELRTPTSLIVGYLEMLVDGVYGELEPDQLGALDRLRGGGHRLLGLVSAALDIIHIQAGRATASSEPVDLDAVFTEVRGELERLRATSVVLEWRNVARARPVLGDAAKVRTILTTLVGNALKFTSEGRVTVTADATAEALLLTVEDTGVGIGEEALPVIFDLFRQADGSDSRHFEGAGLGLHLVQRLVGLLGGSIDATSVVGRGSTFRVTLPQHRVSGRSPDVARVAAAAGDPFADAP